MKYITLDTAIATMAGIGCAVEVLRAGVDPLSGFDIVAYKGSWDLAVPAAYTLSPTPVYSGAPEEAYEGKYAVGRLILVTDPGKNPGLVEVSGDADIVLANGARLGSGAPPSVRKLFPTLIP